MNRAPPDSTQPLPVRLSWLSPAGSAYRLLSPKLRNGWYSVGSVHCDADVSSVGCVEPRSFDLAASAGPAPSSSAPHAAMAVSELRGRITYGIRDLLVHVTGTVTV